MPNLGCENVILCEDRGAAVTCDCGLLFCHSCREPMHWYAQFYWIFYFLCLNHGCCRPATCEMNKWWIDKFEARRKQAEDDMATQEWIKSHSKDCPSCMTPIEKCVL